MFYLFTKIDSISQRIEREAKLKGTDSATGCTDAYRIP